MNTNINITDIHGHVFKYMIMYKELGMIKNSYIRPLIEDPNEISLYRDDNTKKYKRMKNSWEEHNFEPSDEYIPEDNYLSEVILCVPQFSVNSFEQDINYALTINTWVRNIKINLGTYIFNNSDFVALDKPILGMNNTYYECYKINILNPKHILYSDEWKKFREQLCHVNSKGIINTNSSIINFSLHPVELIGKKYNKLNNYLGGQNSINISNQLNDFFNLSITDNLNTSNLEPAIICNLNFNKFYKKDIISYLQETYGIESFRLKYNLFINIDSDVFIIEKFSNPDDLLTCEFKKSDFSKYLYNKNWCEGLKMVCSVEIINDDETAGSLSDSSELPLSNELIFDMEKYKYFRPQIGIEKLEKINNINLKDLDMNVYEINAVNKIQNKIINIEKTEDVKSNIIQPVFFKSYPISNIIVHPNITENISLNLNIYKSRVQTFLLKIGNCMFKEIGRTPTGIIFKIKGTLLNGSETGTYYILNEHEEMIASGKYMFE